MIIILLTYLISLSIIGSIDQSRVSYEIWLSWPHCFVEAVSEVETYTKSEFRCLQAITVVIFGIWCKLNK